MRRASLIAPILIIGIGLLFLVRNVWPEIPVGDLLARYWPFVLIAWGGLRLIEIAFWASQRRPMPRSGVSGGEWLLVIVLCVVGSTMYTARHLNWFPSGHMLRGFVADMGDSFDFTLPAASQPAPGSPRIVIESFRGNARITGGDGNEIKVSGRKMVRAFGQPEADKADGDTPLELVNQGSDIVIRTNQDHVGNGTRVSEDLDIAVPKGASIVAHGRTGDFDIRNVSGSVDIESDNAGVRLDNIGGDAHVEVRRSDIVRASGLKGSLELKGRGEDIDLQGVNGQVTISGTFTGQLQLRNLAQPLRMEGEHVELQIEKLPGQVHMGPGEFTANNLIGPIRLNGRARDVQISDFTQSLEMHLDRGDIELRPSAAALPKIDVHTNSGDIDLALPSSAKFDLRASTGHGELHNEFGGPLTVQENGNGGAVAGVVGSGPEMRLQTERGTLTIRKSEPDTLKVEKQ